MKIKLGGIVSAVARLVTATAKNPAPAVAAATTIVLAVNQVVDGVAAIRRAVKLNKREGQ